MEDVHLIRLVVQKEDSAYLAHWIGAEGRPSEPFDLELTVGEKEAAELRWYLEKFRGFVGAGTRVRAKQVEQRMEIWGRGLFASCLANTSGAPVYRDLLKASKAGRQVLLTLCSNESAFHLQPWELLRDGDKLLAFEGISIRRQLLRTEPVPEKNFRFELPLRLLMVVARPSGAGFIDPRSSMASVLDAVELLGGAAELEFCQPPTLDRLKEMMLAASQAKKPYHIIHFDGHGTYSAKSGKGVLCFEKADGKVDTVEGGALGELLAELDVPLMILEACRTSDLSDAPVFGSVAPALLGAGVGSVVAFSHSVHMAASRILVESFYRHLIRGLTVGQALAEARRSLKDEPERWLHMGPKAKTVDMQDWLIPQLYQLDADPALMVGQAELETMPPPPQAEERMHFFPPKPIYRFHGRAWELSALERAFEQDPAQIITGGGGMGKTALAREAAWWWLRQGRFEEAVFISFEQPTSVERVVQEIGRALEGKSFASRLAEDQRRTALKLFRERKVLLVWDNFESTLPQFQQGEATGPAAYSEEERELLRNFYRQLTASGGKGRLLVTCRPIDSALPDIRVRRLEGLARYDSLHLVHAIATKAEIDLEREGFEPYEVEDLLDLLGDHPLSLSLVGPHLKKLTPAEIRKDFATLLETFTDDKADEERNRSLRASLAFSTSRLSARAQAALPYLAWFQGGVFEACVLEFAMLSPEVWATIRAELESTALLRILALEGFEIPFLRFHPTLGFAARREGVGDVAAAEQRFIAVYLAVMQEVYEALQGNAAAVGMALLEREEANFRLALDLAFRRSEDRLGGQLADTLGLYLVSAARLRERDTLVDWVHEQMKGERLDAACCATIRDKAFSLVGRGRAGDAVAMLQQLIARLEASRGELGEELPFQLGTTHGRLGQIFVNANRPDLALEPSLKAIEILEQMPEEAAQDNLSAALGDLANAYRALGRLNEALAAANRALAIDREAGRERNVAAGLCRYAAILGAQQRWAKAEAQYAEALVLARRLGDLNLQATTLQHQGILHLERGNAGKSIELFGQALALFQQAGDAGNEMRTCDLLASAEMIGGQLDVAEPWYQRARELALALGDQAQLAAAAQNLGILYQRRAEQLEEGEARQGLLRRALASVEESLAIKLERNNQVGAASSYFQLGILNRLLGDLGTADEKSREALRIFEPLDDPNLFKVYHNLAEIAAARGNAHGASEWAAKRNAKIAALRQLRGGGGTPVNPQA